MTAKTGESDVADHPGAAYRDAHYEPSGLYVDGAWIEPSGTERVEITDAGTGRVMGSVPVGTGADVDRAVAAAVEAFPDWSRTAVEPRRAMLLAVADGLAARTAEITSVITREVGMPYHVTEPTQTGLAITDLRTTADVLETFAWSEQIGNATIVREAAGVVGAITPWNYPLHQVCAKVGAALAAGCTIVLKPSEVAPLTAFILAEVFDEVGLPPGVFNLVPGTGRSVGEALVGHPATDMVSFTGSTAVGVRVMSLASAGIKRVALELGGKSANLMLEDADFATAVPLGVDDCFRNAGQNCTALTRMIVPRARLPLVEELARARAESYQAGDLFDAGTTLGALASATQRDRVLEYIAAGRAQGAKLVTGGDLVPPDVAPGFFVQGTVFSDVARDHRIAQEEIFGPVLSIIGYDSEDEAIAIANDSSYGLAGGVWSADEDRAERAARAMRTGRISINGGPFNPAAPFGGFKHSGLGRELGRFGLEEYLEYKTLARRVR